MTQHIKSIIFDWGDTLMLDFPHFKGPMAYWEQVELVTGIKEALELVSTDYICCVASNAGDSDKDLMEVALKRVNINKYFQYLFTSCELGVTKPNINFFTNILNNLDLRPEECIMVGNDYEKDIVPAKAVGIHTILLTEELNIINFIAADYSINTMNRLYEVINSIERMNKPNLD